MASNFNYVKSFPLTSGSLYTLALDAAGTLWSGNVQTQPGVLQPLTTNILPSSAMLSATQDDVEYMCFSNLLQGTDIPRQYNPQPAVGVFTLDRISQVGPGAPPQFQPTTSVAATQAAITSWAAGGGIVTFQAVNTFTAGEVVTLSGFLVSTFFNGLQFSVLGTGLSGTQFEVAFGGSSGPSDSGVATPQYGYPIAHITQIGAQSFTNQDALWSAGPGQSSAGATITFYYKQVSSGPQDSNLVNAFNSGQAVYVYIVNAPFGTGTQLVTGIGSGTPPGAGAPRYYFTIQAPSSSHAQQANGGTYEQTIATLVTAAPIPNVGDGDQLTVSGATPSSWNNTWTIVNALNAGVYLITQTSMALGIGTYTWQWSGTGNPVAPTPGQLVTVIQTLNGNGVFNVTDAVIATVVGGPSSGTLTIAGLGTSSQNVPAAAENGQAQTAGTSFQIDPGALTLGTTSNPIYGTDTNTGIVAVAGGVTSIGAGTRQAVVFFETRNGLKTACSAPVNFTTNVAATYLLADNIPIGPPNVVRRWIAFTTAGPNGIAGPNFYTIDAPVSFTVNNQTFLYTPTYIDDNISTSAKFTFTDSVLLAGDEIDVLGNNLFEQIELGSSAWNIAYAQRMFYGLEQNKVLNFTNLSFDGGYLPNPGGSLLPLGWGLDLQSNQAGVTAASITAFQVIALGLVRRITFTAANNFVFGIQVVISGLSSAYGIANLNGVTFTIQSATPTGFTAITITPVTPLTSDSGTASPLIQTGGTLVVSPVFGNAYYINNQSNATQSTFGMIIQNAYQDAYNVPIILPNVQYSVRVTASIPSGKTVGSLIVDLTGSNVGLASGTGSPSTYGATYGSFVLPFASMTAQTAIYSGTLLTTPFTTGVPVGLLLRAWAQNVGVGADVLIDRIEVYPTATPLLATNVRVSYVDNFEAFDANTGNLGLASHNTQPCYGAFEMHDQLYFLQSGSMQSTQDVPGIEPSNPGGGWALHEVSNRVGTCGIHAYDYGEEWILTACRNGIYGFNGGQPIRIDFQQREIWEALNWTYGYSIWLANDLPNSRILVGVPLPTPNKWLPLAPVNANPTSPNVILMWNYQNLDTFEEIVSGRGVHTTMFGTLAAVDMRLKMSIWQIASPFAGFVTQPDLTTQALTICNGAANGKMYTLSVDQLSDDGVAINSKYFTFGFVDAAKAKENPLLGLHRKRFQMVQQLITGVGTASVEAYPNYILNAKTLVFNPDVYSDPGGITLQEDPPDDILRPLNSAGNRVFLAYGTNATGASFHLSKVILVGTIDPYTAVNPNSG